MSLLHAFFLILLALRGAAPFEHTVKASETRRTQNVILVTYDGLRWQEVFTGADAALLSKEAGGVQDPEKLKRSFWRDTAEGRRAALMPFLWDFVAKHGQVYGNGAKGSVASVTNGKNFSYPGYNEILCGFGDPRIDSNDKKSNPNVSVLEWLNGKEDYRGRVAAFAEWDCFAWILNRERSLMTVNAGIEPLLGSERSERQKVLDEVLLETTWPHADQRSDSLTFLMGLEHMRSTKPRVFYFAFGETDEFAHEKRYDLVLEAAHRTDAQLARLWEFLKSTPGYAGQTTLLVTTDHGRGDGPEEWKNHGVKVAGSERIWLAVLGPDTPALGERSDCAPVTQGQVAATLAALLGEDWCTAEPRAAKPIAEVLGGR